MTIIARSLPPPPGALARAESPPWVTISTTTPHRFEDVVAAPSSSTSFGGVVAEPAGAGSASALGAQLQAELRDRLRAVVDESAAARPSSTAIRDGLLDQLDGSRPSSGEGAVGNPHAPGSRAWFEHGRQTGVWVSVPGPELVRLLGDHALRPDPSQPDLDLRHEARLAQYREGMDGRPEWERELVRAPVQGLDTRPQGVRSFAQQAVLTYLDQVARASSFLSLAASAGAEPEQLAVLLDAALRRGRLELHVGGDPAAALESDDGLQLGAGRSAVANQAFWLQLRAGDKDVTFGSIHELLPVAPREAFRAFAEDSRIAENIRAAGDRMMTELLDAAQKLGLEVFDAPQRTRERIAGAISAFQREQALPLVRLAGLPDGAEQLRELDALTSRLLSLSLRDLEALAAELD